MDSSDLPEAMSARDTTPLVLSPPQRDATIERLTTAFAEDAITMDEFERRAELVYRAATIDDLKLLLQDLPSSQGASSQGASLERSDEAEGVAMLGAQLVNTITSVLSSTERKGAMKVPRYLRVRTLLGSLALDLRHAVFQTGVTEIHVNCVLGNVEIWAPAGARVEMGCDALLGNVQSDVPEPAEGALADVVIRITGRALLGNVELRPGWTRNG